MGFTTLDKEAGPARISGTASFACVCLFMNKADGKKIQPSYVSDNGALNVHVKGKPDQKVCISIKYKMFEVISSVRPKQRRSPLQQEGA